MPPRARRCVICHRLLGEGEDRWFPFCSERCKWVDLGRWLGEAYRIAGHSAASEPPASGRRERGAAEAAEEGEEG